MRECVRMAMVLAPNEEWALDFVADALASARSLRTLTAVDAFTRELGGQVGSTRISVEGLFKRSNMQVGYIGALSFSGNCMPRSASDRITDVPVVRIHCGLSFRTSH
jgi:hypothetical protein